MQNKQVNKRRLALETDGFLTGAALKTSRSEPLIRIDISRNTLLAIIFSLLLHAVVLFFAPTINFDTPQKPPATMIEVSLFPKPAVKMVEEITPEKPETPVKKPAHEPPESKVIAQKPMPKIVKTDKSAVVVPEEMVKPKPEVNVTAPKPKELRPEDFPDMQSYVKAVQAQRQGSEFDAARQNAEAAARERGPSEEQVKEERIKRNLQTGTNGIFEITSLGARNATFSFRGWTNDYSASKRQYFEVEAQAGQDVRLVMVRRMIALIREHYTGDFQWESHRLGRSVMQSARPEDNAGLEDFLMMEFFGSNYKKSF